MTDPFFESQIYKSESVRPTPNLLPQERSLCLDQDLCDIILKKKHTMADIRKIQAIYGKFDDKTQSLHREVVRFLQIRNEYGLSPVTKHPNQDIISQWFPLPQHFQPYQNKKQAEFNYYYFVDCNQLFWYMMTKISKETIIAVDVEANEWDGYTGMMCLIQISTHEENFILDCLSLPQEIKSKLKSVFESPSTLKVMHGCGNDLRWLQRDFQIFVWPVVDTQLIERKFGAVTGNENCGFAELTDRYLHIKITKEEKVLGQFSDYRSRPLHQDLILYAVNDSRLLIQVWEHQKQKFFGDGLTISKSKDLQIMMSQLAFSSLFAGQKPVSSHPTATSTHDTQILHNIKNVREKLAIKLNLPVQLIGSDSVISGAIKAGTPPNKVHPVFREILKTGWPSKSFALPQTTPKATTTCMRCGAADHIARDCTSTNQTKSQVRKAFYEANPEAKLKEKERKRVKRAEKRRVTGETSTWFNSKK